MAQGIKNAIRAGVWSVEHGSFQDEEATRMLAETNTYLIPTLSIGRWFLKHGREEGLTAKALEKGMVVCAHHYDAIRRAVKAGVKLAAGTDAIGSMHGGNADELAALVEEIGFSPMQAIVAATRNGAEVCRMADRVGTIEAGKLAEVLLLNGDPLNDIRILKDKERLTVFKQGTLVAGGESLQQRQRS